MPIEQALSPHTEDRILHMEHELSAQREKMVGTETSLKYISEAVTKGFAELNVKVDANAALMEKKLDTMEVVVDVLAEKLSEIEKERAKSLARWSTLKNYVLPVAGGGILYVIQKIGALIIAAMATP